MAEITGGELLARCLANEGIKFVFGLPCPEVDPLLAAWAAHHDGSTALDADLLVRLPDLRRPRPGLDRLAHLVRVSGQYRTALVIPHTDQKRQ